MKITFLDLLQILFIALKLLGIVHWSWWWVLAPIWITLSIATVIIIGAALIAIIVK